MFSLLNKEGELGIRLPKASQTKFKEEHKSTIFMSHGAVMRDYVLVPDSLLQNLDLLVKYLDEGYEFVMTLEPK